MRAVLAGLCLAALALVATACGSSGGSDAATSVVPTTPPTTAVPKGPTPDDVDNRSFVATKVTGHQLAPGGYFKVRFDGRQLAALGGCNSGVGAYELLDGRLRWYQQPSSTEKACDQALMDQDQWVADWLVGGVDVTLDGDRLTLAGDGTTIELVDQASLNGAAPLVGTTWKLQTITNGDVASSVPSNVKKATLRFRADGQVEVFTGCNRGSGTYTAAKDGATITFGPLALTKTACTRDAGTVESAIVTVLDGTVDSAIDGTTLELAKGDQGLGYFAS